MSARERRTAAYVNRTNGAYLIEWTNESGDLAESECFSAASSFEKAKRVALNEAPLGWEGPHRWEEIRPHLWALLMFDEDDES